MSRSLVIAKRELNSYFLSPVAYVAMTLFLVVSGYLFAQDFIAGRPAEMRNVFDWMVWILTFIVPVLGMGLLAQELATGTIESLMTAPVGETDVVLGKFLGSVGFFVLLMAPTLLYVVLLSCYSKGSDLGAIFCGYLGIAMVGSLFIAVTLFCSSLTRSQVVAAVSAAAILFAITIVPWELLSSSKIDPFWRNVAEQGVLSRYMDFSKGVFDTGHMVFFVLTTAAFLFFTVKVLEWRRWK